MYLLTLITLPLQNLSFMISEFQHLDFFFSTHSMSRFSLLVFAPPPLCFLPQRKVVHHLTFLCKLLSSMSVVRLHHALAWVWLITTWTPQSLKPESSPVHQASSPKFPFLLVQTPITGSLKLLSFFRPFLITSLCNISVLVIYPIALWGQYS